MTATRVVVLGAGTGGTLAANRLRRAFSSADLAITVVDQDDHHVYQPGLLFVPFGRTRLDQLTRPRRQQLRPGVNYLQAVIDRVDTSGNQVLLAGGEKLHYDVLVIATGARLQPEATEGLLGPGWMRSVFTFYTPDGAVALATALDQFDGGQIVVNVIDMPIKCPVAPLEFCFLADDFFRRRGIRDRVQLSYVTPLDAAFTKPVAAARLASMLDRKGIELVTDFDTGEVDGAEGRLTAYDGRSVAFDLAVVIPAHGGADYIGRSPGLGDALNFIPADARTLQTRAAGNVFVIGDAANVPASKAGSVAHFEGDVLVANIERYLAGNPLVAGFDGHTNCFIETGAGKSLLIDFNYDTEPLPGHYPGPVGLPLLTESRLNHLGKLAFQWFYWHLLLPGRDVPGLHAAMPTHGKQHIATARGRQ